MCQAPVGFLASKTQSYRCGKVHTQILSNLSSRMLIPVHLLLSMVVLNSRECQGKLRFPKNMPWNTLKQYYHKKLSINVLVKPYQLRIDSKSLKTRLEWSYRILKISKTASARCLLFNMHLLRVYWIMLYPSRYETTCKQNI